MKAPFITDVPVALIFFNRPEVLKEVFECVRKNKPSKLFLIQDGAREGNDKDAKCVAECRYIVSNVDWNCEVYRDYSEVNLGCGRRVSSGITNAFKIVDRLVIVEDDILFSESFLPFCAELLEKYKNDNRINIVCGMNHFGNYEDCPYSYFFSRGGAIWGWATWKHVWDEIDFNLEIADDKYLNITLERNMYPRNYGRYLSNKAKMVRNMIKNGKFPSYWSFHSLYHAYAMNRINIVPKYNMTSNIGLTVEAAHTSTVYKKMPKCEQILFFAKMHNIEFPLKHPKFLVDDRYFKECQDELMNPTGFRKLMTIFEIYYKKFFVKV